MRYFCTFLLLMFSCQLKAVTVCITFNPLNCIACSSGIFDLSKEAQIKRIILIARSSYQEDSSDISEKYELGKLSKVKLLFSDSLYDTFQGKEFDAEFILFSDKTKKALYKGKLNKINLGSVRSYYAAEEMTLIDSICTTSVNKKLGYFLPFANSIITVSKYDKYHVLTTPDNNETPIIFNDSFWVGLYKEYYKDSFKIKYPVIREIMDEMPTLKPMIETISSWDDTTLMITFKIKIYTLEKKDDTAIYSAHFVGKYDIKSHSLKAVYGIDKSMPKEFFLWTIYKGKDNFWGEGALKDTYCMLKLSLNEKKKLFTYVSTTKIKRPESYKIMKVSSLEEDNTVVDHDLLAFSYDDKITTLSNLNQVTIPFGSMFIDTANKKLIVDLSQDELNYYVLYVEREVYHVLQFSKTKGSHKDVIVGNKVNMHQMSFYNSGNKIIYKPVDKDCLFIKELSFE